MGWTAPRLTPKDLVGLTASEIAQLRDWEEIATSLEELQANDIIRQFGDSPSFLKKQIDILQRDWAQTKPQLEWQAKDQIAKHECSAKFAVVEMSMMSRITEAKLKYLEQSLTQSRQAFPEKSGCASVLLAFTVSVLILLV